MRKINFVTIGDKNFFEPINFSVDQINKIYPESKTFVYDWGFTETQKEILKQKGAYVLAWDIIDNNIVIKFSSFFQKIKVIYGIRDIRSFLIFLRDKKYKKRSSLKMIKRENLFINKTLCLQDYIKNFGGNFVFLDGDAFIINNFDEILEQDFDIGVTLRRKHEIRLGFGECNALNAGVLFFLGGNEKNKA